MFLLPIAEKTARIFKRLKAFLLAFLSLDATLQRRLATALRRTCFMELLPGVIKEERDGYALYVVERLSEELKKEIRDRLSAICNGAARAKSPCSLYSYPETAKEFVRRYKESEKSSQNRRKGMIGELLAHVILEIESRFIAASPFFNMEERNFKKGFDIMMFEPKARELWLAEVKAGSKRKSHKDATTSLVGLLNDAQNDLYERLNSNDSGPWRNAMNAVCVAMSGASSETSVMNKILSQHADNAIARTNSSQRFNVVLIGALFHPTTSERIDATIVGKKHAKIVEAQYFKNALVVAIQKGTFEAVYDFLNSEANDETSIQTQLNA